MWGLGFWIIGLQGSLLESRGVFVLRFFVVIAVFFAFHAQAFIGLRPLCKAHTSDRCAPAWRSSLRSVEPWDLGPRGEVTHRSVLLLHPQLLDSQGQRGLTLQLPLLVCLSGSLPRPGRTARLVTSWKTMHLPCQLEWTSAEKLLIAE